MNKTEKFVILGIIFSILYNFVNFSVLCDHINSKILRLHIMANSNSEIDQNIKICIKNKIQNFMKDTLEQAKNKNEAEQICTKKLSEIKKIAENELNNHKINNKVEVKIKNSYFKTREYESITMPAGNYDAVEIKIGTGKGENWWCILFPTLCIGTATAEHMHKHLKKEEIKCTNKKKFKAKFKILEICKNLKQKTNK